MNINSLKNKKIGILGLGIENYALIFYILDKKIPCEITICDIRTKRQLSKRAEAISKRVKDKNIIKWRLKDYNKNLHDFDIVFRSPGWSMRCPGIQEAIRAKSQKSKVESQRFLYSPMKLFFDLCPTQNIIGVTGTKGKGTVSSMIYQIIKKSGKRVWLGGNIGVAPFAFFKKIKKSDWVVLELSSFQLEDIHKSPRVAVFTNFSKEHLLPADINNPNYHKNMKGYWQAKANIFRFQKSNNFLVASAKLKTRLKSTRPKGRIVLFSKSEAESSLMGEHNKENVAAALEVAKIIKIKKETAEQAIREFKGLPFRIEYVPNKRRALVYNDSFATIPDSAIIALRSFRAPVILIAGGADKGSDFLKFAKEIKKRVKYLVLFDGAGSARIKKELKKINYQTKNIKIVYNMKEAVKQAVKKWHKGDIILLSPGCASFGVFKNYKERGDLFEKEIKNNL